MPRHRPPREIWRALRIIVLERDGYACTHCRAPVHDDDTYDATQANVDHIVSGKRGTNKVPNLRTLCARCHVTRADNRHRGMMARALAAGVIPPDWPSLAWEDDHPP